MTRRSGRMLVTLVSTAVVAGCSTSASTASTAPLATPDGAVTSYFHAMGAGRCRQAAAELAPSLRGDFLHSPESDCGNTMTVSRLVVHVRPAPFAATSFPRYSDIRQALVTYDARYRRIMAAPDGPQTRFVYVGRTSPTRPWQILEIGTGP